jgi:2-phospho-L-lactate/phosphoenolpyruvate guanylyltransferase
MARRDQPTGPSVFGLGHPRLVALVALKRPEIAKSRLASLPAPLRSRLAWTMALDTLSSLAEVLPVIVISQQANLAEQLRRQDISAQVIGERAATGINAALRHGEEAATAAKFSGTLACVADLPAVRPTSIQTVLAAAPEVPRAFVADASGEGTTMLISRGTQLDPRFQGRSAEAHRASGALELGINELGGRLPDARRDVDNEADLSEAFQLGLGPATRQLFDAAGSLGRYAMIMTGELLADGARTAVTRSGSHLIMNENCADAQLSQLKSGQRMHAVISSDRVLSAWLR